MNANSADAATPRLHVLLAMWFLVRHSGAELFTRDLALWLRRRGHSVTVFAPVLGDMANELRHESIACISDPALLARRPDVIVGNTHNETVRAILRFPDVPAISICHDRSHEHGRPPRLTQIRRYIAVDENCKERLCHEHGIAPELVGLIQNGVDLDRFARRSPLPARPQRALVFSSYARDDALLSRIRAACAEAGIRLDVIGEGVGNLVIEPGALLVDYDLVFAKGRAATEALAVGCACILLDHSQHSMGFMVRSANAESARQWNFGRALLTRPITHENLAEAIAQYDSIDATRVCEWIREHAGLDATGVAFEHVIKELLQQQPAIELAPAQQVAELLRYTNDWIEAGHPTGEHLLLAQLREQVLQMHRDLNAQQASLEEAEAGISQLRAEREEAIAQALQLHAEREEAEGQNESLRNQLRACGDMLDAHSERERSLTEQLRRVEQDNASAMRTNAEAMRDAQAREQALHAHVQAILASASWRITAPLRTGLDLIGKLLGRS